MSLKGRLMRGGPVGHVPHHEEQYIHKNDKSQMTAIRLIHSHIHLAATRFLPPSEFRLPYSRNILCLLLSFCNAWNCKRILLKRAFYG